LKGPILATQVLRRSSKSNTNRLVDSSKTRRDCYRSELSVPAVEELSMVADPFTENKAIVCRDAGEVQTFDEVDSGNVSSVSEVSDFVLNPSGRITSPIAASNPSSFRMQVNSTLIVRCIRNSKLEGRNTVPLTLIILAGVGVATLVIVSAIAFTRWKFSFDTAHDMYSVSSSIVAGNSYTTSSAFTQNTTSSSRITSDELGIAGNEWEADYASLDPSAMLGAGNTIFSEEEPSGPNANESQGQVFPAATRANENVSDDDFRSFDTSKASSPTAITVTDTTSTAASELSPESIRFGRLSSISSHEYFVPDVYGRSRR